MKVYLNFWKVTVCLLCHNFNICGAPQTRESFFTTSEARAHLIKKNTLILLIRLMSYPNVKGKTSVDLFSQLFNQYNYSNISKQVFARIHLRVTMSTVIQLKP